MKSLGMVFAISILMAACGDDSSTIDSGTIDGSNGPDSGGADAAPGASPVISQVAWTTPAGCVMLTPSVYTITIDVTDADTAMANLVYTGNVTSCTGQITTNPATITCPNQAPYQGSVMVSDGAAGGNHSDTQAITITPCTNGSAP